MTDNEYDFLIANRFKSLEQRCVNGRYNHGLITSRNGQQQSYMKKGIRLEVNFQEFKQFMYENREIFEEMSVQGLRPTVGRKDITKHYSKDNIEIIPKIETYNRRWNKQCSEASETVKEKKKAMNRKIYSAMKKRLDEED